MTVISHILVCAIGVTLFGNAFVFPEGIYGSHPGGENWIDMVCNFSRTKKTVDINITCNPNAPYFGGYFSLVKMKGYQAVRIDEGRQYKMMLKEYNDHCGPLKADPRKDDFAVYKYMNGPLELETTLDDLFIMLYPEAFFRAG